MQYTAHYESPLGGLLLAADDVGLTGLWFDGEKYYALHLAREHEMRQTAVHEQTAAWLDVYFSGREPDFMPPLHLIGTPFQQEVWALLRQIPYGKTTTYGALAKTLAAQRDWNECPRRPWAARWGTMKFRFWCLATGLSEPEEA